MNSCTSFSNNSFCCDVKLAQSSKNVFCSGVSATMFKSSAKNCARVIPNASQIVSSVGMLGMVFRRKMLIMVEELRPVSFASRYAVQLRCCIRFSRRLITSVISIAPFRIYCRGKFLVVVVFRCNLYMAFMSILCYTTDRSLAKHLKFRFSNRTFCVLISKEE